MKRTVIFQIIICICICAVSISFAKDFPFAGRWDFQERGQSGGYALSPIYYPDTLDVYSPSSLLFRFKQYSYLSDNIVSNIGTVPDIMIWENDTTQTFQFQLIHCFLDSKVDTNFTWNELRKYFYFKIESLDGKTIFHQPFDQGDPDRKLVLRDRREIGYFFYYSYNTINVPFSKNIPYKVTLQFFEQPDTTSEIYHEFSPHIISKYSPETVQDSVIWAWVTRQYKNNPQRYNLFKYFAERIPRSIEVQKMFLNILWEDRNWDEYDKQYNYILFLYENSIDISMINSFPQAYPTGGRSIKSKKEYFSRNFYDMLKLYRSLR